MILLAFALVGVAAVLTVAGTARDDGVGLLLSAIVVAVVALIALAVGVVRANVQRRQPGSSSDDGAAAGEGAADADDS